MLLVTGKMQLVPSIYNYNALLLFYDNVDNHNRVIDANWLISNLDQELYLTNVNHAADTTTEYIILGNTADIANKPTEIIYTVKRKEDFEGKLLYKNFSCDFLGDRVMLMENKFFGRCVNSCPQSFYKDSLSLRCVKCPAHCLTCDENRECTSCPAGSFLQDGFCENC